MRNSMLVIAGPHKLYLVKLLVELLDADDDTQESIIHYWLGEREYLFTK